MSCSWRGPDVPELELTIGARLIFPGPSLSTQRGGWLHPLLHDFYAAIRTCTRVTVNQTFTDAPPKVVTLLQEHEDGTWSVPRGMLLEVQQTLKATRNDALWAPSVTVNVGTPMSLDAIEARSEGALTFRPYQRELSTKIVEKRQGVVVLPCGAGKTVTGLATALSTGEATLIVVHLTDLADQWAGAYRRMTGRSPRMIGESEHDTRPLAPGEVCVALVQSIRQNLSAYTPLLQSTGFLLVDEAHRAPSDTFGEVVNACPARYRIGLSATPKRADGLSPVLHAYMGPVIYSLPGGAQYLVRQGYLREPKIVMVRSPFKPGKDCAEWTVSCPDCAKSTDLKRQSRAEVVLTGMEDRRAFVSGELRHKTKGCGYIFKGSESVSYGPTIGAIAQSKAGLDAARNLIAVDLTKSAVDFGRAVLVLTNRKAAVADLVSRLRALGVDAAGLTSEDSKDYRTEVLRKARIGIVRCVVATQLADEGLDVPALDTLVLLSGGRDQGLAQQRLGRICRVGGHDTPLCFDLVDDYYGAKKNAELRIDAYRSAYGQDCVPTHKVVTANTAIEVMRLCDYDLDFAVHKLLSATR